MIFFAFLEQIDRSFSETTFLLAATDAGSLMLLLNTNSIAMLGKGPGCYSLSPRPHTYVHRHYNGGKDR